MEHQWKMYRLIVVYIIYNSNTIYNNNFDVRNMSGLDYIYILKYIFLYLFKCTFLMSNLHVIGGGAGCQPLLS